VSKSARDAERPPPAQVELVALRTHTKPTQSEVAGGEAAAMGGDSHNIMNSATPHHILYAKARAVKRWIPSQPSDISMAELAAVRPHPPV